LCFIVCKTTSKLKCTILTTLYFAGAENTNRCHARKGDLQRAFPLDISMVHPSVLVVSSDGDGLMCGGFSLSETICFESLEFITDCFSGLSLSSRRNDSSTTFMGLTRSGPLSLLP
jgi:hypothetical protein